MPLKVTVAVVDAMVMIDAQRRSVGRVAVASKIGRKRVVPGRDRGLRNKAIASELQCSEGTVKVHLHNIFQKLSIKSRWVLIAQACDLLSPATSKPGRTFVDTTPALDEIPQRLTQVLVFGGVP